MTKLKNKIIKLIYFLQKHFKTDLFYLIKGESWLILGKAISTITVFLLALAWANWIDKEIYGNYQYILSLIGIISIFSLPGLGIAVTQAVARKFEGSFVQVFKIQLKWGMLASLSAIFIAGYYWTQGNKNIPLSFLVVAIFLFLFNASLIYTSFLIGKKSFSTQVKYESITQVIASAIMLLVLYFIKIFLFNIPDSIILLLIITTYFASRTFLRFFFFIKTKIRFSPNTKKDPKTITFGKHLSALSLIEVLANNLDKILLFHYLGAIELAIYSFSILIPQQINVLLKHISALALPKFSVRSRKEIKKTILKKIYYLTIIISVLVLIYIIVAPFVYQTFFPKYTSSIPYSRLYALSIIPLCFAFISGVFYSKMMTKQIYQIKIIAPLFRAGLFLILIPLYGIWGAIIAIIGARTFNALLALYMYRKI